MVAQPQPCDSGILFWPSVHTKLHSIMIAKEKFREQLTQSFMLEGLLIVKASFFPLEEHRKYLYNSADP
jgi:hypothetical protein